MLYKSHKEGRVSPKVSARDLRDFKKVTAYSEAKKKFGLRSDNKVSAKA